MERNRRREVPTAAQPPLLAVVKAGRRDPEPCLRVAEAEAMADLASWLRARARRLPDESGLRRQWLEAAGEYSLSARLLHPGLARLERAERPATA